MSQARNKMYDNDPLDPFYGGPPNGEPLSAGSYFILGGIAAVLLFVFLYLHFTSK